MRINFLATVFLMSLLMVSCGKTSSSPESIEGFKPVYLVESELKKIYVSDPIPIQNPGRIYYYKNLIFINEAARGVHIVENSDPKSPKQLKFINIPASGNISIKGD
jgi:hypothetical protein